MTPRIAITGIGLVTRFGDLDGTWRAALEGLDGSGPFEVEAPGPTPGWTVVAVPPEALPPSPPASGRPCDRSVLLALEAARRAWQDAGASSSSLPPGRRAVLLGTGRGCLTSTEEVYRTLWAGDSMDRAMQRLSPFAASQSGVATAAAAVSMRFHCRGPSMALSAACASSAHAMGLAARLLQTGMADLVLAGGCEAPLTASYLALLHRSGILSRERCRPFDRRRDGLVLGEGAGILVLERLEAARARGGRVRAEILGYGASCDAVSFHAPDPEGGPLADAMQQALREGALDPGDVGYVKAHGTATVKGDRAETLAIARALGGAASRTPTGSLKPLVGHTIGASTAIEAGLAVRALEEGLVPPTANLEDPDVPAPLRFIRGTPAPLEGRAALVNTAGFGGTNACLALGRA